MWPSQPWDNPMGSYDMAYRIQDDPRMNPDFGTGALLQPGYGSGAPMGGMPQYEEMQFQPFKNGNWAMPMMQAGAALLSSGGRDFGAAMGTFGQGLLAERARQQALHDRDYGREMEQWKTEYGMERDEEADRRYEEKFGYQQEQDEYKRGQDVYDQGQDAQAQANWEAEFGAEGDEAAARQAYNDRIAALRERELALREERQGGGEPGRPYTDQDIEDWAKQLPEKMWVGTGNEEKEVTVPWEQRMAQAKAELDRFHGVERESVDPAMDAIQRIQSGERTLDQTQQQLNALVKSGKMEMQEALRLYASIQRGLR